MDHVFISSSVNGHVGGFRVLAMMNNAAVNTGAGGCHFKFEVCLDRCPEVGWLDCMAVLF